MRKRVIGVVVAGVMLIGTVGIAGSATAQDLTASNATTTSSTAATTAAGTSVTSTEAKTATPASGSATTSSGSASSTTKQATPAQASADASTPTVQPTPAATESASSTAASSTAASSTAKMQTAPTTSSSAGLWGVTTTTSATHSISGKVVDASDNPIKGVNVNAYSYPSINSAGSVTTGPDGKFIVPSLPDGSYVFTFSADGYLGQYLDGHEPLVAVKGADISLKTDTVLLRGHPGHSITGKVVDGSGKPIDGAFVDTYSSSGSNCGGVITDPDGRFTVSNLSDGTYIFSLYANGYGYAASSPVKVEGADVTLNSNMVLSGGTGKYWISGRIVDESGNPISGVSVYAALTPDHGDGATTDADGLFKIPNLNDGSYTLSFYATGYLPVSSSTTVNGTGVSLGSNVVLSRGHSITGKVVDESGNPISGVCVGAMDASSTPDIGCWDSSDLTNTAGKFTISDLPEGSYILNATASGYMSLTSSSPVKVEGADAVTLKSDIRLERATANITGTVGSQDGSPVGRALISAYRWDGSSWKLADHISGWGDYSFGYSDMSGQGETPFAAGTYTVGFAADGFCTQYWNAQSSLEDATSFTLANGQKKTGIDAILKEATSGCAAQPSVTAGSVSVSGKPTVGQTLTADPGSWNPTSVQLAYQWTANGTPIRGATASTLALTSDLAGKLVAVTVTGSRPGYTSSSASSAVVTVELATQTVRVALNHSSTSPGQPINVHGSGFLPGEQVEVVLHSQPQILTTVKAGTDGQVNANVTIPNGTPVGNHQIVLVGQSSGRSASSALIVQTSAVTPSPTTPSNGSGFQSTSTGNGSTGPSGTAKAVSSSTQGSQTLATTGSVVSPSVIVCCVVMLGTAITLLVIRRRSEA